MLSASHLSKFFKLEYPIHQHHSYECIVTSRIHYILKEKKEKINKKNGWSIFSQLFLENTIYFQKWLNTKFPFGIVFKIHIFGNKHSYFDWENMSSFLFPIKLSPHFPDHTVVRYELDSQHACIYIFKLIWPLQMSRLLQNSCNCFQHEHRFWGFLVSIISLEPFFSYIKFSM